MAKIEFKGIDKYQDLLAKLSMRSEGICKQAVYEGAAVVIDAIKTNLRKVVSENSTGDLEKSIGLAPMENKNGYINTKVGFDGYDRNGHPNIVKARALESGTSKQRKRPFIRPAVNSVKEKSIDVMAKKVSELLEKQMKGWK